MPAKDIIITQKEKDNRMILGSERFGFGVDFWMEQDRAEFHTRDILFDV